MFQSFQREVKMKREFILAAVVLMACLPSVVWSQQQPIKIGVVDSNRTIQESVTGKNFLNALEEQRRQKQEEIAAKENKLQEDQQNYQKQMFSLSEDARGRTEKDLQQRQLELQRIKEDAESELRSFYTDGITSIERKVLPVIEQVAKEKGLVLILENAPQRGMLFVDPSIDITDEVIARLDQTQAGTQPKN